MLGGLTPHPELTAHAAHPDLWLSTCSLWFVPYTWSLRQGREVGREDGARGRMVCVGWWWWGVVVVGRIWVVKNSLGGEKNNLGGEKKRLGGEKIKSKCRKWWWILVVFFCGFFSCTFSL